MRNALRASALLATIASIGGLAAAMPTPRRYNGRTPNVELAPAVMEEARRRKHALSQEIAAHNAAVDLAKAEKRARKAAKR